LRTIVAIHARTAKNSIPIIVSIKGEMAPPKDDNMFREARILTIPYK